MEEADKDWMLIRMVGGWVFLLVPAHPGSPGQRAVKRLLLLLLLLSYVIILQVKYNHYSNIIYIWLTLLRLPYHG